MKPTLLCIMDGIAISEETYGNAFKQANTPNFDMLWNTYPHSLLEACGPLVGLPEGQMGNSEVGHMNIGAGRIVYQPLQAINESIKNGELYENSNIKEVIQHVKDNKSKLHILGLLSDGGIHSHINHLMAVIDMCEKENITNIYYHLFLDGRDTKPDVSYYFIKQLEDKIKQIDLGKIATIAGRYYAMDRDKRWDRVELYYNALVNGIGENYNEPKEVIDSNYNRNITDEFVIPAVIDANGKVEDNDGLIFYNFRPDRLREICSVLTNPDYQSFDRKIINNLKLVTMFPVGDTVIGKHAFELDKLDNTLGEYLSNKGLSQLRIAETEKYAHVTYFFDGGIEKELPKCDKLMIPSPKVATYDLKPEMSAIEITTALLKEIDRNYYDVIILNYANGDMVGHTGDFKATIKAVETVDHCLGLIYNKIKEKNGTLLITADHGNSDEMLDKDGNVITSHSMNKVPFIITNENIKLKEGKLGDIAPTMLDILNIEKPKEMTGESLIKK